MAMKQVECSPSKRRKFRNSISSLIEELPDDLLQEILVRLPAKYAVQCKAVSKRWLSLISHPYYVQCHQSQHDQLYDSCFKFFIRCRAWNGEVLLKHLKSTSSGPRLEAPDQNKDQPHPLNFVPCFREQQPHVVASFNDLLICCEVVIFQSIFYICNPLTKKWLMLPPATGFHRETMVGFICYPRSSHDNIGYTYKVVRIPKFTGFTTKFAVEIFCSESGKWSQSVVFSPRGLNIMTSLIWWREPLVAYSGSLHWIHEGENILAYDPLKNPERCRVIDVPAEAKPEPYATICQCLGVCRGRLQISKLTSYYPCLSVWGLENYNTGKWRLEYKVELRNMVSRDPVMLQSARSYMPPVNMIAFHPFDVDIVYLDFPGRSTTFVVSCNMRTGTLELVSKLQHEGKRIRFLWLDVFPIAHPSWPTPLPPLIDTNLGASSS